MVSGGETLHLEIAPELAGALRASVERGEYASLSELVGDALRAWQTRTAEDHAELRRLIRHGIESGPGFDADHVLAELKAEFGSKPR